MLILIILIYCDHKRLAFVLSPFLYWGCLGFGWRAALVINYCSALSLYCYDFSHGLRVLTTLITSNWSAKFLIKTSIGILPNISYNLAGSSSLSTISIINLVFY
jgi:hypothetical protein